MRLEAEVATLADAVAKAARVAPQRGPGFIEAGGITFRFHDGLVVESTDLESTYRQHVSVISITDASPAAHWRLPSALINSILSTLPMDHGVHVILEEDDTGAIKITCGRTKAKLRQIELPPPAIVQFDTESLLDAPDFAKRLAQVAWAAHPKNAPMSGVRITGEYLVATDGLRMASVPCKVPVDSPVTVPLATLASIIKAAPNVALRATDDRLLVATDADTQMSSLLYAQPYPEVLRAMRTDFEYESKVSSAALLAAIQRMLVLVKGEEFPLLKLTFGEKTIGIDMQVPEIGLMSDEVDIDDGPFKPVEIWFTPQYVTAALSHADADQVTLRYGPAEKSLAVFGPNDYRCDVAPRQGVVKGAAASAA